MNFFAACLPLVVLVAGCDRERAHSIPDPNQAILQLSNSVADLKFSVQLADRRLGALETKIPEAVRLNVDKTEVFGSCHTSVGIIVVSIRGVEDHSGSHKVAVRVGNTTSATFLNVDWEATWFTNWVIFGGNTVRVPAGSTKGRWPDSLASGHWSHRDIILPCSREQLRDFELTLLPGSISLPTTKP